MYPGLGIFLSRDPWDGDVLRPGSMNGWGYAEGNAINRFDPTGLYSYFTDAEVEGIRSMMFWFFDSATRHNITGSNMNNGVFAALIVSLMKNEGAFNSFNDPFFDDWRSLRDMIGAAFVDKGLGPIGIQESTLSGIINGLVRTTSAFDEQFDGRRREYICHYYHLKPIFDDGRFANEGAYFEVLAMQQNYEYSIDIAGAVIEEGIVYMQFNGERPALFNLMTWWMGGVATDFDLNVRGAAVRGQARTLGEKVFPEAIDIVYQAQLTALYAINRLEGRPSNDPHYASGIYDYTYDLGPSYHKYVTLSSP